MEISAFCLSVVPLHLQLCKFHSSGKKLTLIRRYVCMGAWLLLLADESQLSPSRSGKGRKERKKVVLLHPLLDILWCGVHVPCLSSVRFGASPMCFTRSRVRMHDCGINQSILSQHLAYVVFAQLLNVLGIHLNFSLSVYAARSPQPTYGRTS